jgi:hypothetical protein
VTATATLPTLTMPRFQSTRRVLVASPDPEDGISWWRAWGPWCHVAEACPNVDLMAASLSRGGMPPWSKIEYSSIVISDRPYSTASSPVVPNALAHGRPCIVDIDDLVWEIPKGNKARTMLSGQDMEACTESCKGASEVTVTTPFLKEYIEDRIAPDATVTVVPNVLPDWYEWSTAPREKVILWRGGLSHISDIDLVAEDIARVSNDHPDYTFLFVGNDPWPVTRLLPPERYTSVGVLPLPIFHRMLRGRGFSVMMIPLEDCAFNHAKSNISWMEGTLSGARVVGPDFEQFRRPGVVTYKDGGFGEALRQAIEEDSAAPVQASRDFIDANLRGRHAIMQRVDMLKRWTSDMP